MIGGAAFLLVIAVAGVFLALWLAYAAGAGRCEEIVFLAVVIGLAGLLLTFAAARLMP